MIQMYNHKEVKRNLEVFFVKLCETFSLCEVDKYRVETFFYMDWNKYKFSTWTINVTSGEQSYHHMSQVLTYIEPWSWGSAFDSDLISSCSIARYHALHTAGWVKFPRGNLFLMWHLLKWIRRCWIRLIQFKEKEKILWFRCFWEVAPKLNFWHLLLQSKVICKMGIM